MEGRRRRVLDQGLHVDDRLGVAAVDVQRLGELANKLDGGVGSIDERPGRTGEGLDSISRPEPKPTEVAVVDRVEAVAATGVHVELDQLPGAVPVRGLAPAGDGAAVGRGAEWGGVVGALVGTEQEDLEESAGLTVEGGPFLQDVAVDRTPGWRGRHLPAGSRSR